MLNWKNNFNFCFNKKAGLIVRLFYCILFLKLSAFPAHYNNPVV